MLQQVSLFISVHGAFLDLLKAYLGCVICCCNRFHYSLVRTARFWTFWKHTWVVLSVTASLQQVSFNINQTSQWLHTHWRWRCGLLSLEMSISQNYGKRCRCLPRFIQILKQSWNKDYIYLLWIHISKDFFFNSQVFIKRWYSKMYSDITHCQSYLIQIQILFKVGV